MRVWDAGGQASASSESAEWTTALLDPKQAKGAWIAHPDHSLRSGPLPLFRREVAIGRRLLRATVLVSGVGFHELRINGAKVDDHVFAPAWTNYRATMLYETFDVTGMLKAGANAPLSAPARRHPQPWNRLATPAKKPGP